MSICRKLVAGTVLGAFVACALAVSPVRAFTMQDKDSAAVPKFDLDEQMRNFRKSDTDFSSANKNALEMPFGSGTLQFDVRQGSSRDFMSPGLGLSPGLGGGPAPRNSREDFNRVLTPENLR